MLFLLVYVFAYWSVCSFDRTLPESIRWLVTKHRFKEAERILQKAAKVNGVKLPENPLVSFMLCYIVMVF